MLNSGRSLLVRVSENVCIKFGKILFKRTIIRKREYKSTMITADFDSPIKISALLYFDILERDLIHKISFI